MRPYLRQRFREIHRALKQAKQLQDTLPESEQFLAGYLVVLISGIFEDCVEDLFIERAKLTSDRQLVSFVGETMHRSFRNPTYHNISGFLGRLDHGYKDCFSQNVAQVYRDGLDAIVTNKNSLAHGKSVNVTLRDVIGYYFRATRVFQGLERILF